MTQLGFKLLPGPDPTGWRVAICLLAGVLLLTSDAQKVTGHPNLRWSDIALGAHGLLVDQKGKEIKLANPDIERLQDSLIESLTAVPDSPELDDFPPPLAKDYVERILTGFKFSRDERVLTKSALIQTGIDLARIDERPEYQKRFDLIHERLLQSLNSKFSIRPAFGQYLSFVDLETVVSMKLLRSRDRIQEQIELYFSLCRINQVPIPPDWPGPGWVLRGELENTFLDTIFKSKRTEVWTFEPSGGGGLCYALPRFEGNSVDLLGIICQSQVSGKACFWDNLDAFEIGRERRIQGTVDRTRATLRIARLENGGTLGENCTECHRGYNAFIIHPDTALSRGLSTNPKVRYTPIGQAHWVNPPPFLPQKPDNPCTKCHEIASPSKGYYCDILSQAAQKTMPPAGTKAGWDSPTPTYAATILALKMGCQEPVPAGALTDPPK